MMEEAFGWAKVVRFSRGKGSAGAQWTRFVKPRKGPSRVNFGGWCQAEGSPGILGFSVSRTAHKQLLWIWIDGGPTVRHPLPRWRHSGVGSIECPRDSACARAATPGP